MFQFFLSDPNARSSGAEILDETGLLSGTLYPILKRLENEGVLVSEWETLNKDEVQMGTPRRRFYKLTGKGKRVATESVSEHLKGFGFLGGTV